MRRVELFSLHAEISKIEKSFKKKKKKEDFDSNNHRWTAVIETQQPSLIFLFNNWSSTGGGRARAFLYFPLFRHFHAESELVQVAAVLDRIGQRNLVIFFSFHSINIGRCVTYKRNTMESYIFLFFFSTQPIWSHK